MCGAGVGFVLDLKRDFRRIDSLDLGGRGVMIFFLRNYVMCEC